MKDVLNRMVELVSEDKELHDAIVRSINALTKAEESRAAWYDRRGK